MVWDTIIARDAGRSEPVEEWGGIAYALSAFAAVRPPGFTMLPIIKVGADLTERAGRFFGSLSGIDSLAGIRTVPEPNNRVTLRYTDSRRRTEVLEGAVPGWKFDQLAPLIADCDALYVNFIAGWELELEAAIALRQEFRGPIYCDLHSIFLGVGADGTRVPRALDEWREWLACFDFVQLNKTELDLLAMSWGDPWRLAAEVVGAETKAMFVTLEDRGAAWVCAPGFNRLSRDTSEGRIEPAVPARSGMETVEAVHDGDPTGCGDVWGITCFLHLLRGAAAREAVRAANRVAARNASLRGASGLARLLGDAVDPGVLEPDREGW